MSTSTAYFAIYSNTSRNSMSGLRPKVMWAFEDEILQNAAAEINRSGENLADLAGIEWIEVDGNMQPSRDLTHEEVVALSIEKLGDDGRLFITFRTNQEGAAEFIEAAEYHGLGDDARAIVERFNPDLGVRHQAEESGTAEKQPGSGGSSADDGPSP